MYISPVSYLQNYKQDAKQWQKETTAPPSPIRQ